jgi:selT/selW/selH-like putative selenoprotein
MSLEFRFEYCAPCGLDELGKRMETIIRGAYPDPKMNFAYVAENSVEAKGKLDLYLNEQLIYSKKTEGRLNTQEKLVKLLNKISLFFKNEPQTKTLE